MILNKNRFCLLGLFLLMLPCIHGQNLNTPAEVDPIPANDPVFCTPGVSNKSKSKGLVLEYGLRSGFNTTTTSILSESSSTTRINSIEEFKLKVSSPGQQANPKSPGRL